MDVRIGECAVIVFRINEQQGTAEDETKQYFEFVEFLANEFIPYSTARMAYVNTETDDAYWAVRISVEDYANIKTAYNIMTERKEE